MKKQYFLKLRRFVSSLRFYLLNSIILHIPSRRIRKLVFKKSLFYLGKNTGLLRGIEVRFPANISIGNHSVINKDVLLDGRGGKIVIGENVDIAQEVNLWTLGHDVNSDFHSAKGGDVIIEDYVWIASRVTILPGVTIGKGSVVAACSVVTKDIPPMCIYAGIPAKKIGDRKSNLNYTLDYNPLFR